MLGFVCLDERWSLWLKEKNPVRPFRSPKLAGRGSLQLWDTRLILFSLILFPRDIHWWSSKWISVSLSFSLTLLELQESPQCSPCPQSSLVWMTPCPRCRMSRQWMCKCGSAPSLCFCRSLSMQRWITSPQWKSGSNSTEERYSFALRVSSFQNVAALVSFPVLW